MFRGYQIQQRNKDFIGRRKYHIYIIDWKVELTDV